MSPRISVQEAQTQLPILIARTTQDAEPCYIESNGKVVAVLVGLRQWQHLGQGSDDAATAAKAQERRIRAYQKKMQQLGPDYWLSPDQQVRLKELVDKRDGTHISDRVMTDSSSLAKLRLDALRLQHSG